MILFVTTNLCSQNPYLEFKYLEEIEASKYTAIKNSSFEKFIGERYQFNKGIKSWVTCGFNKTSPSTLLLNDHLQFEIVDSAYIGEAYINLVTREDGTWEAISQKLKRGLAANQKYYIGMYACLSKELKSALAINFDNNKLKFGNAVIIRILGGNENCNYYEILSESPPITNESWREYAFVLEPTKRIEWITIEAYYVSDDIKPYNGNVSIDAVSSIYKIK